MLCETVKEKWQACYRNMLSLELQIKTKPCFCHLKKKGKRKKKGGSFVNTVVLATLKCIAGGLLGEVPLASDGAKGRGMRDFIKLQRSFSAVLPLPALPLPD